MIYVIAFLDTFAIFGAAVSGWLLRYSLLQDRRYWTEDNTKFYLKNPDRLKHITALVACASWIFASFVVIP